MCGVCGIIDFSGKKVDPSRIRKMATLLEHRGPDDEGIFCKDNVGIGHRRLAILDLTQAGHQPMTNEDNTIWIVFNGEIYNFNELKTKLTHLGHKFKSCSDTEVIIHGYEEWGTSCWEKLDGMFAFALWDERKEELYLVRDPFAIKPLYWTQQNNAIIFASEIKSILGSGMVDRRVNYSTLSNFFTYFYTPGPETMIEDVFHVKPGRAITFSKKNVSEHRYWRLRPNESLKSVKFDDLLDMLKAECRHAVKKSLVSDVPVGLLLSSGLDSNIILSELLNLKCRDLQTITVGFRESSFDEASLVKKTVGNLGIKSHIVYTEDHDIPAVFDHMVYHQDSLNANVANLPEYLIVKAASKYAKVVLAGAGNDELFAGYSTYMADKIRPYYLLFPRFIRNLIGKLAGRLPQREYKYSLDYLFRKFVEGAEYSPQKSHYWWRTIFTDEAKKELFAGHASLSTTASDSFLIYKRYYDEVEKEFSFSAQSLYADFFLFCNENANMMVDNLSMAFSLEVRPPFLTKRFVEFAFNIPYNIKLKGNITKYCLRKAYSKNLSKRIVNSKKSGLVSPVSQLIRGPLKDMIYDTFAGASKYGYLNKPYIDRLLSDHMSGRKNYAFHIYLLFTFMRWHEIFISSTSECT